MEIFFIYLLLFFVGLLLGCFVVGLVMGTGIFPYPRGFTPPEDDYWEE